MVPSPERNPDTHGGSSITASLQSIAYAVGIGDLADRTLPLTGRKGGSVVQDERPGYHAPRILSLPTRRIADTLMLNFWTYIHPIFPVLHRPTIETMYKSLWVSDAEPSSQGLGENSRIEKAILNIAFALGCQGSDQEDTAEQFYRKSTEYYSTDTIDLPSLETVQLLVLTGVYLQSTQYASRCWSVVGSAIRYAQYLGLDVERAGRVFRSQLEQEMRRRVWYNCVILDRFVFHL